METMIGTPELIENLIQRCYDTLHTESKEAVANDIVEALHNWEKEECVETTLSWFQEVNFVSLRKISERKYHNMEKLLNSI